MHAIERRPNHFRFQARRSRSTPTNFHSSFIHSKSNEIGAAGPSSAQLFPRAARKNRIGVGRSTAADKRSILSAGSRKRGIPHGAGNSQKSRLFPPKVRETLSVPPPSPSIIRFPFDSIFYLPPSTFPFVRTIRRKRRWKMYFSFFFFRGKLKRNFVVGFVCLRNEECFENKWMECCF